MIKLKNIITTNRMKGIEAFYVLVRRQCFKNMIVRKFGKEFYLNNYCSHALLKF
jgi:hypothetical protein